LNINLFLTIIIKYSYTVLKNKPLDIYWPIVNQKLNFVQGNISLGKIQQFMWLIEVIISRFDELIIQEKAELNSKSYF